MLGVAWGKGAGPCSREEAERRIKDPDHPWYGRRALRRADTHKALNALIQGSAARHTKLWMRACWREGIVPLLQMHDCSTVRCRRRRRRRAWPSWAAEVVALEVPMRVDVKFGRSWGGAKHSWEELHGEAKAAPDTGSDFETAPDLTDLVAETEGDLDADLEDEMGRDLKDDAAEDVSEMVLGLRAPEIIDQQAPGAVEFTAPTTADGEMPPPEPEEPTDPKNRRAATGARAAATAMAAMGTAAATMTATPPAKSRAARQSRNISTRTRTGATT